MIEAARKCMARDGLDAQMEEIARTAGVGVGTVYRHFPTKDDLVEALADDRFDRLAELAQEAFEVADPWEAFAGFMQAGAQIQSEDRALSEVLTSRPETMMRAAERVGMLELTRRLMRRAQAAGEVRKDADPRDVPLMMCALAGTWCSPFANPDRYIAIVLAGLRPPASGKPKLPPVRDTTAG